MQYPRLYQYIEFLNDGKHHELCVMLLTGKVIKIDYEEQEYIVSADYGLDFVKFKELLRVE